MTAAVRHAPPTDRRPAVRDPRLAPRPPLLGLLAGWIALFSWSGMVAEPLDFLVPTWLVGLVMALAGSGLRMVRVAAVRRRGGAGRSSGCSAST